MTQALSEPTANLQRFVDAQAPVYAQALAELRAGRKRTHWMWFVFPQCAGLGASATAQRERQRSSPGRSMRSTRARAIRERSRCSRAGDGHRGTRIRWRLPAGDLVEGARARPAQIVFRGFSVALDTWLIYLLAATGLSLSPGPNSLLALTHGALHGGRMTTFTIMGGALGFVVLIALSMFGIGALLAASAGWLVAMKWVGGAYLAWLGIQVWRSPPIEARVQGVAAPRGGASMFRQGALSALTNPKGLLFFAAFLPQFVDPARSLVTQFAIMAGTFALIEILTEAVIAGAAHRISPWLARTGRRFNRACGGVFVAIGAALPLRG